MRKYFFPFLAIVVASLLYRVYRTEEPPDEVTVRGVIRSVADGVEAKNISKIMRVLDDSYRDNRQNTRSSLCAMLFRIFNAYEELHTSLSRIRVEIVDDSARAEFTAKVISSGDTWRGVFTVYLVKVKGKWLISQVHLIEKTG